MSPARFRSSDGAASWNDDIDNEDLNWLATLVERRGSHFDDADLTLRSRLPHIQDFALDMEFVARLHRPRPFQFVATHADNAAGPA